MAGVISLLDDAAISASCGENERAGNGSAGRIRTYNQPVNSRLLYR